MQALWGHSQSDLTLDSGNGLSRKATIPMRQLEEVHICLKGFPGLLQRLETDGRSSVGYRVFLLQPKISAGFLQRRLARQSAFGT